MNSSTNTTITIKCQFDGSDLRRRTIELPEPRLSLAHLQKVVAELFQLDQNQALRITYTDEDGDAITIGCDEDAEEAVRVALSAAKPMLRLRASSAAPTSAPTQPSASNNTSRPCKAFGGMLGMLGGLAMVQKMHTEFEKHKPEIEKNMQKMQAEFEKHKPEIEKQVQKMQAEFEKHKPEIEKQAKAMFSGSDPATSLANMFRPAQSNNTTQSASTESPVHYGVVCDVTGMNPIVGARYKKQLCDYDLCQEAFDQLSEDEKKLFSRIDTPADAMRLWEEEAEAHLAQSELPAQPVHEGIWCDHTGMNPIIGPRYTKQMENDTFDLCQAAYDALSEEEKGGFFCISTPEDAAAVAEAKAAYQAETKTASKAQAAAAAEAARVEAQAAAEAARVAEETEAARIAAEAEARLQAELAQIAAAEEAKAEATRLAVERVAAQIAEEEAEAAKQKAAEEAEVADLPEWQAAMDALIQMGFDPVAARAHSAAAKGDLEVAIEAALTCSPPPPPEPDWNSTWDLMIEELAEMGFEDVDANKCAIMANSGILKDTVTALVAAERAARKAP